jgi:trans-aconitate methyltransferase
MSVATHLGIDLKEYDARIRTFIPHYEEMLDVAAAALDPRSRVIVDLGIGTGALAARCLQRVPRAKIVGIDADAEILHSARSRLPGNTQFVCNSFLSADVPDCDAVVASFALHHVRTPSAKEKLYSRIAASLRGGGQIITVDCQPAADAALAAQQRLGWKAHLMHSYSEREAEGYLEAWSHEDVYVTLNAEIELMCKAGFSVEILWRKDVFAVLRGTSERRTRRSRGN